MKKWIVWGLLLLGSVFFGSTVKVGSFIGNCEYSLDGQTWTLVEYGMSIPVSAHVRVPGRGDSLELVWDDGSSVQLLGTTVIQVVSIQQEKSSKNLLKLVLGKVFAKVQKKKGTVFEIQTETAVAAVRGTRFLVSFMPGRGGQVIVSEGSVEVFDPQQTAPPRIVKVGEKIALPETIAQLPAPTQATVEEIKSFDENYMPPVQQTQPPVSPQPVQPAPEPEPKKEVPQPKKGGEGFGFDWALGGENIDGQLWNKVILSPVLRLGNFGVGLYIPVYFISFDDLGNPNLWYNAKEWDFSSFGDGLQDLLLKVRFLEYKNKWLLFRFGSLPNMTLGHGILINNYANDLQFPAVRKIGAQIEMDFNVVGFDVLTGNAFLWDMAGARFFVRPFFGKPFIGKLGFGVSGFYDRIPLSLSTNKQIAFGYAADVDLPLFEVNESLFMVLYSDVATLGYHDSDLNISTNFLGWGWATGVKGSLVLLDYRAEYRYLRDGFLIGYVNAMYDANRSVRYGQLTNRNERQDYAGFLLEAGKTFKGLGWVSLQYEHLFSLFETNTTMNLNTLHMEAGIEKNVIKWGYGSLAYDRVNFNLVDLFTSFPGNGSVVSANIYYAVSPGAFLGIQFKRYYEVDAVTGELRAKDTFGITTQMGF